MLGAALEAGLTPDVLIGCSVGALHAAVLAGEPSLQGVVVFHVGNFDRARPAPKRPIDVLLQAFSIARSYRFLVETDLRPPGVELVVLPGFDPGPMRRNDFSHSSELIDKAWTNARAFL